MQKASLLTSIPIEKITRSKCQPRTNFDQEELHKLALSIKNNGLIQPIVVKPIKDFYEIVAGERRWRAAQIAGLPTILCIIQNYSDLKAAQIAMIENTIRHDLNPIEEANSYRTFTEKFNLNHEEIANITGKSRSSITNSLRLLSLHKTTQEMLAQKHLSEGHGKIIASLPQEEQKIVSLKCYKLNWSVRQLESFIRKTKNTKRQKIKDLNLCRLEQLLSQHCGTNINIHDKQGKGFLKIKYNSYTSLNNILKKINFDIDEI